MAGSNSKPHSPEVLNSCMKCIDQMEGVSRRHRFFSIFILVIISSIPLILNRNYNFNYNVIKRRASTGGIHSPVIFGHVHMAKTGGTSLNGILANKFEHVCGHKGYSYDAFGDNERAKAKEGTVKEGTGAQWSRSRVNPDIMEIIGYQDCDYISHETNYQFWINHFGDGKFHDVQMELHVPCRNRIEHLMSQCNYQEVGKHIKHHKQKLACNAKTDEQLFESVKKCFLYLERYDHELLNHFDVKCFDFDKQFTGYVDYMSGFLNRRRIESEPYIKRETNDPRNKQDECIWNNPNVLEKVDKYLLDTVPYYQFCDSCMGTKHEISLA